jgi:phage virion morphogenesis protein
MAGTGIVYAEYKKSEYRAILDALEKVSMPKLLKLAQFAGKELSNISKKAFEQEKDPVTGTKWEKLERKRPNGKENPILRYSGHLFRTLTYNAYPDGSVIFGSNVIYAHVHQAGYENIPARPYLGAPDGLDRKILNDPAVQELLGLKD